jgi:OOP family OmpA-OmpF porin
VTGTRHRPPATVLFALATLSLALVTVAAGPVTAVSAVPVAAAPPGRPPARSLTIPSRVVRLTPRIEDITARVLDLKPKPKVSSGATTFSVNSDILFAFDQYTLSPDAEALLGSVVSKLQTAKPGTVTIVGYTDDIGKAPYNLALSRHRAASVATYLSAHVGGHGITYVTEGRGEADPWPPTSCPTVRTIRPAASKTAGS